MKQLTFILIVIFCFSIAEAKQSDFSKNIDLIFDHVDLKREPACAIGVIKNNEFLHKYSALEILERVNSGEKTMLIDPVEGDKPLV